jgi:tripartite-type tricarboxylate transporter receptor subunit TctC
MVVHPGVPAKTLQEWVVLAKSKPGQLSYGSSGIGGAGHLAGELLKMMAHIEITHVPFKGGGPAMQAMLGGQIDSYFATPVAAGPHVKAGKVKALATTGAARSAVMPDVPTMSEAGVPGYEAVIWLGLMAPKGTPPAVVSRLNAEVTKIVGRPEVKAEWARQGATAMAMTPEAFTKYLNDDIVKWQRIVRVSGAKPDQ